MKSPQYILLWASVAFASACGQLPDPATDVVHKTAKAPKLITFNERLKQQAKERGNAYGSTEWATQVAAGDSTPTPLIVGSGFHFSEQVLNEGPASKGMKIVLRGSAIQQGLLGGPTEVKILSYKDPPGNKIPNGFQPNMENRGAPLATKTAVISQGPGEWVALVPDIPYESVCEVEAEIPAQQAGNADLIIDVYPLDPAGSSTATFSNKCAIEKND